MSWAITSQQITQRAVPVKCVAGRQVKSDLAQHTAAAPTKVALSKALHVRSCGALVQGVDGMCGHLSTRAGRGSSVGAGIE